MPRVNRFMAFSGDYMRRVLGHEWMAYPTESPVMYATAIGQGGTIPSTSITEAPGRGISLRDGLRPIQGSSVPKTCAENAISASDQLHDTHVQQIQEDCLQIQSVQHQPIMLARYMQE